MKLLSKHPRALPFLFLTEMWERFGYYVVQGLLILYMTKAFGFSDSHGYTILGVFAALAYIAPFPGGMLADRVLGFKTAVVLGGIFLSVGYAMLALPWEKGFYLSLATIIVGTGLFKPNVSSLLGSLYEVGDPQRESGFTIFYIGINLGVLLSGITSGLVLNHFGWHASFGLASAGLVFGVAIFAYGLRYINVKNSAFDPVSTASKKVQAAVVVGCIAAVFVISLFMQNQLLAKWLLPISGVVLIAYLIYVALKQEPIYQRRMFTLIILILSSVIFWMIFLQIFFSANLFIDRLIDRQMFGFEIPTTVFYSLESIFVILFGPVFAWSWYALNESYRNPSPFLKFIIAIVFVGLAFLALGCSTYFANDNHLVNPLWVALSYLLLTLGELLLSPIGLSAVTTLSPRKIMGMMMGIWFVALGFGGQFAGFLAKLSNIPESVTDAASQLVIYRGAFLDYAWIAFSVAVALFVIHMFLKNVLETD